jgi:Tfp pilus assembly protein PilF
MAGQQNEAKLAFSAALQQKPSASEVHFNFGVFLGRQGDFQAAAREFRSALALQPGYPQAHCLLANALARLGDSAASAIELTRARELGECASDPGRR